MKAGVILGVVLAGVLACDSGSDLDDAIPQCFGTVYPALRITVIDSISSEPVYHPLAWVRDGEFTDTLDVGDNIALGPLGRPGVYDVWVEKEEYLTWTEVGVSVDTTVNSCTLGTVELTARMQRSPDR